MFLTTLANIPWGAVADGLQIGLCAAILSGMIWSRARARRRRAAPGLAGPPVFAGEVLREILAQNVAQAMDAIAHTVEVERQRLRRVCEPGAGPQAAGERFPTAPPRCDILTGRAEADDRYAGVLRLSAAGLPPRRIADELGLPEGEVELVAKLKAADAGR